MEGSRRAGVQVMETSLRVLGLEHPDTLTSIFSLAMTYLNQGRRTEAEGLLIEAVKQRRSTLGEGHSSTAAAIAKLTSFQEEHSALAPLFRANDLLERLWDGALRFATSWL